MQAVRVKKGPSARATKEKMEFARIIERYKRVASILDTDEFALVESILSSCEMNDYYVDHTTDALKVNVYEYKCPSYISNDVKIVRVKNAFNSIVESMEPDRIRTSMNAEAGYVMWLYEWDFEFQVGEETKIIPFKVDLTCYLDKDSTQCRRVQTGTKEVPIYSYDCSVPADVVDPATLPPPVILID